MPKKKRIYLAGLLCLSLMGYTIEAKQVEEQEINSEFPVEEELYEQVEELECQEELEELWQINQKIQEALNIEPIRFQTFISQEDIINQRDFARMLCYTLRLSPIYTQVPDEDPYIASLKKAGIWSDAIPQQLTELDQDIIDQCIQMAKDYKGESLSTSFFRPAPIGFMQKSTMRVKVNEQIYPMYYLSDVNYVRLSDLRQIGFEVTSYEDYMHLTLKEDTEVLPKVPEIKSLTNQVTTLHTEKIYIGNVLSYALKCGDEVLIPLRGLSEYYDLSIEGELCTLKEKYNMSTHYIELAPGFVHNISDEIIQVQIVSVFWNGKELIEDQFTIQELMPDEYYPLHEGLYALNQEVVHASTMVAEIQTDAIRMAVPYKSYGQHTESLLKSYTRHQNETLETYMNKLFPESKIIGTMKYDTKGFKKGEKVEVWAAEDGYYYYLLKEGKKIEVPWNSVSIPPNPIVCKEQVPNEVIEGYVNSKQVKSKTPYFIWTDLYRQRTYVFENKEGSWKLLRSMPTSTGNNKTPTPTGEFEVQAYVPAFGMNKGYRCKNALHLFGDYLYHSVMFDVGGRYVLGGQGQLGERASHGCLRLSPENSQWLYQTIPLGTKVWIK
ncbi:MAG: L,D-transpeptidase [Candidatus Niameybacter stercoravium]|nr:L,D-transpeptidase [Candidatus Niameybacter stercoravium]